MTKNVKVFYCQSDLCILSSAMSSVVRIALILKTLKEPKRKRIVNFDLFVIVLDAYSYELLAIFDLCQLGFTLSQFYTDFAFRKKCFFQSKPSDLSKQSDENGDNAKMTTSA